MSRRAEVTSEIDATLLRFIAHVVLFNQVVAQRLRLGASDVQFLSLLSLHGPMSPEQLVDLTGLSSGTVTGVLDRPESGGFVDRERDTADKRWVLVRPNAEALRRTALHYAEYVEHTNQVLSRRSVDELRVIASFLGELADAPPTVPPPGSGAAP